MRKPCSYWLGLCPQLRFYRSGGAFADAATTVSYFKWIHVAVTYDGSTARFYVNGEPAGTSALSNAGTGGAHSVMIGRDHAFLPYHFGGNLDEIRLWRGTRTQSQIRQGMWEEPRDETNLAAVFDTGGSYELLGDLTGVPRPIRPAESGLGILPRTMRVPKSPLGNPVVNGSIDVTTEYAGAERFVIRNRGSTADSEGYLVHNGSTLFIALQDVFAPDSAVTDEESFCSVHIDTDNSGGSFADAGDLRIAQTLGTIKRLDEGNGLGGYQAASNNSGWSAGKGPAFDEFAAANMEFSINLARLGGTAALALTETDRFAFARTGVASVSDRYPWPGNAAYNSPATWAPMTYIDEIAGAPLATGSYNGRVVDSITGNALAGRTVRLISAGGLQYAITTTNAAGGFLIQRNVPPIPLTVQLSLNEGEFSVAPSILINRTGPAPDLTRPAHAIYPACTAGDCNFDTVQFNIRTAIGATSVAAIPSSVTAPLTVRGGAAPKVHPAGEAVLTGTNFHPDLEVYFTTSVNLDGNPPLTGLTEGTHYWRAVVRSQTRTTLTVVCPDVPLNRRPSPLRIVMRDFWNRPANHPLIAWKVAPGSIFVQNPPYPLVHGFEFQNVEDGHDIDDYRAVFAGDVCNPFTMVGFWAYFPIYLDVLGGGECYGMTITSQQFSKGRATAPFGADVFFANGFSTARPATFNVDNFCAPSPTNVWGQIRVNHGTQMSAETIAALLAQFGVRFGQIVTNQTEAIARLTSRPLDFHLCFYFGDSGHCVQPLRVISEVRNAAGVVMPEMRQIEIYDCNWPNVTRVINVNLATNRYDYDGFEELWSGQMMPIYETEALLSRGNHLPGLDTLTRAALQLLVSGDAEPMVTSPDGGQVGWNAAGDFIQTSTDTSHIPVFNWIDSSAPPLGHYPVTMFHTLTGAAPNVDIHARGANYKVHAANQGSMFQLFVSEAVNGQDDALGFTRNAAEVNGLSFAPTGGNRKVKALIALCQGGEKFPAAISLANLSVPAGKSMVMRSLPGSTGIEFLNDTGLPQTPVIEVALPKANAPAPHLVTPPAIEFPVGSSFQMRSPGGIDFTDLIAELDLNRDGTPEQRWMFHTGTGILKVIPVIPPVTDVPVLSLVRSGESAKLTWPHTAGWVLTTSTDLMNWSPVPDVIPGEPITTYSISLPANENRVLYFRLEKR